MNKNSHQLSFANIVPPVLARDAWVEACHFHSLSQAEVLREVAERVKNDPRALVLLDLDSTLYEVAPRSQQILKEWVESEESRAFALVRDRLANLTLAQVGYSVRDTFRNCGVRGEDAQEVAALESAKKFWALRFFTHEYLKYDHPYPGAAEFSQDLYDLGAQIVYLTGRDEPGMGRGTRENLVRDGFPWEKERTHLLLKAAAHLPDLNHKKEAASYIRQFGKLVASFENEPPNLIALYEIFPDAMHVFVDTICSDHGAEPRQGLYRIQGFEI